MPQRERERIVWRPVWDEKFQGWAKKFLYANLWRIDSIHDIDDLMQDAYITFVRIADTYPRVIEPRNFMALYKMALANKIHDRSLYRKRRMAAEVVLSSDVSEFFTGRIGEMTNAGYVMALLNEAPEEVRMALNLLAKGLPEEGKPKRRSLQPKENLSMRLARYLGLGPDADPLTTLRKLLTQGKDA